MKNKRHVAAILLVGCACLGATRAIAQTGTPAFQFTEKDGSFEQKIDVMDSVKTVVKHGLTQNDLKRMVGKMPFEEKQTMTVLLPHLKKLLGSRYGELERAFKKSVTGPLDWEDGGLVARAGAGKNSYHAIFEFNVNGEVRAAVKDTGTEIATCTDFGEVNPGYFCEQVF
jgi:hypothetical protein